MALTGTELLMNADLFRMTFPNWPGVARSQAPASDDAERGECGHFEAECTCPVFVAQPADPYFAELCTKGSPR